MEPKNTVDLLNRIRGQKDAIGLRIVVVDTTEPDTLRLRFEGTQKALHAGVFEIPYNLYPLKKGDHFLAYQMTGTGAAVRFGLVQKLNGCSVNLATMQSATSLKIDGMDKTYAAADLLIPPYVVVGKTTGTDGDLLPANVRALQAGDRVSVAPVLSDGVIKYAVLNKY